MRPAKISYPFIYLRSRDENWELTCMGEGPKDENALKIQIGEKIIYPRKYKISPKSQGDFAASREYVKNLNLLHEVDSDSYERWCFKINEIHSHLNDPQDKLEKVVLSRSKELYYSKEIDSWLYFLHMVETYDNLPNYLFYYAPNSKESYISCSPEKIFSMKKNISTYIEVESMAGTISPNQDTGLNGEFTSKELEEQQIVTRSMLDCLEKFSPHTDWNLIDDIHQLKNIGHKRTKIKGLAPLGHFYNYSDLLELLTPSASIAGYPKNLAKKLLEKLETRPRNMYAQNIGVIHDSFVEFFVGIRCCVIKDHKITLYAGCGITKDSNPEKEWLESKLKMKSCMHSL